MPTDDIDARSASPAPTAGPSSAVRWLGRIKAGCRRAQVASLIDLMPTLLELAGCAGPATMQGQSLADVLFGQSDTANDDCAFIECLLEGIGVRTPTHLYGLGMQDELGKVDELATMFFDLRTDPYQQCNLAASGEQEALARHLRKRLETWDVQTVWMR